MLNFSENISKVGRGQYWYKKSLTAIEILNKRARRPSKNNSTQPTSTIQLDLLEELIMSQKTGENQIASGDYRVSAIIDPITSLLAWRGKP